MELKNFLVIGALVGSVGMFAACAGSPEAAGPRQAGPRLAERVAPATGQSPNDQVVATVNGRSITLGQLQRPLIEARGLNVLLNLVQLELAKQHAAAAGVGVSEQDVENERELTIAGLFQPTFEEHERQLELIEQQRRGALRRPDADPDQVNAAFDRRRRQTIDSFEADLRTLIEQYHDEKISRPEFDIVITTNAYLRQVADLQIRDQITDEAVQQAFRALYGETVRVRHIQLNNMQEVAAARRRLTAHEPFEQVAREMSRNPQTAARGGELPIFSMAMTGLPESFRIAAFGLRVGEVSDPVHADGAYHLIKLEERFEPRAVKFEDVQESVREELYTQWVQAAVTELRAALGEQALAGLRIEEPTLREQFERRMSRGQSRPQEPSPAMEEMLQP